MLEVDVSEHIGTLTLNRPEARNALSGELVSARSATPWSTSTGATTCT